MIPEEEIISELTKTIEYLKNARRRENREHNISKAVFHLEVLLRELGDYDEALVVSLEGMGALLCNRCAAIIDSGFDHEDIKHYCEKCKNEG